ncbi:amidohydrolase family protein [Roseobacter sp.]|uniref:amidohydrolase family protein n=1 Tax=Roseobacter sp. TaxID=1907202 RepID=UPI0032968971
MHLGKWTYDLKIGEGTLQAAADLIADYRDPTSLRSGVVLVPHAPDICSPDLLRQVRDDTGLRINTHVSQGGVEVDFIHVRDRMSLPELLEEVGLPADSLIGAHCIHVSDTDIVVVQAPIWRITLREIRPMVTWL